MADRRMIHRKVVESDTFYKLSTAAQALYMHLTINADEDGFVNCAANVTAQLRGGKKALGELVEGRYLLRFGEVYVLKHWRIGNSLKNDRTRPPAFPDIADRIWVRENRAYTDHPVDGCRTLLEIKTGIRSESQQNRTEQNRTELNRTELNRTEAPDGAFEGLWTSYPTNRRGSKTAAQKAYRTAISTEEEAKAAQEALQRWKVSKEWTKDGGQYVPLLHNWLERDYWRSAPDDTTATGWRLGAAELDAIQRMMETGEVGRADGIFQEGL